MLVLLRVVDDERDVEFDTGVLLVVLLTVEVPLEFLEADTLLLFILLLLVVLLYFEVALLEVDALLRLVVFTLFEA
ncbi:hypothetical protein PK35_15015 [Tamlana nanhaiensis]|uniref:Uncharacterized protein n=1 Tax=Neotamlana nanhaiensis TaxID=1382798 RepID=A0A0D7W0Q6_9FLAO|nr:hypothetical protein PK35_15015 [Tamlana nanhaiensis]